ncbi:hypothetical protein OIV42_32670, partial [Burkholderia pseudomallei]|nr:hypothetical protein [Burkholderia pseudomallei]
LAASDATEHVPARLAGGAETPRTLAASAPYQLCRFEEPIATRHRFFPTLTTESQRAGPVDEPDPVA